MLIFYYVSKTAPGTAALRWLNSDSDHQAKNKSLYQLF